MSWALAAITVGAVGAAVSAGSFFAFSNFVMPALAELPPEDGASAMQSINRFAPTPLFVAAIMGAGLAGVPVVISEWGRWDDGRFAWLVAAVVLSLLSAIITMAFNVPRNDALEALDAAAPTTEAAWGAYVSSWTRWNTARTLTSVASVVTYVMSVRGR